MVATIDILHIERPVLIGHSIAGEELSSIGTRYPQKVSGLIYLDAGYAYALYSANAGSLERVGFDQTDLESDLARADSDNFFVCKAAVDRLIETDMPRLEHDLRMQRTFEAALPTPTSSGGQPPDHIGRAIIFGERRYYGPINVPILAIYASPHNWKRIFPRNDVRSAAAGKTEFDDQLTQIHAFQKHLPNAK